MKVPSCCCSRWSGGLEKRWADAINKFSKSLMLEDEQGCSESLYSHQYTYIPVAALLFQSLCFMAMFPGQYFWPIRVAVPGNCGEPGMGRGQRLVHWVSHKSLTTLSLTAGLASNRHSARTISGQNGPWLTNPTAVCSPLCFISVPTLHRWKKWSKNGLKAEQEKLPSQN